MVSVGQYRITLLPGADEAAFVARMTEELFNDPSLLGATRITRGISNTLLRRQGEWPEFVWQARVDQMNDRDYDFGDDNLERVRQGIAAFGVVTGLEVYRESGDAESS